MQKVKTTKKSSKATKKAGKKSTTTKKTSNKSAKNGTTDIKKTLTRARRKAATTDVITANGDVEMTASKTSSRKKDTKGKTKTGEMLTGQRN